MNADQQEARLSREYHVLRGLAEKGPLNKYGICKFAQKNVGSKPTILETIARMENDQLIKEDHIVKRARGTSGTSRYFDLTLWGLISVIQQYGDYAKKSDNPRQFAAHLAEKYRVFLPNTFNLWPEFIREKAQDPAWRKLQEVCRLVTPNQVDGSIFGLIVNDLRSADKPDHEKWVELVGRNQKIRQVLVHLTAGALATQMEDWNATLRLLLTWKTEVPFDSKAFQRLRNALRETVELLPESPK